MDGYDETLSPIKFPHCQLAGAGEGRLGGGK